MAVDCYSILGLDRSAPDELIDKAYRVLARRLHPDSGANPDPEEFARVHKAYEALSDPASRATYDASMLEAERSGHASAHDIYQLLPLRFEQAVSGGRISIARITKSGPASLDIDVPAAVENGERLRITGYGQPGANGQTGDLVLIVAVEPHRTFRRQGLDLYVEVPVPVDIAMLGGKIKAPSLNGPVDVDVPAGTSGGANLRVRAKGLHNPNGQHGDLFVVPRIKIPRAVADEARSLAEAGGERKLDARVVLYDALGNQREFTLGGAATLVGRKSPSDLVIPDTSVSRRHCQFEIRDDKLWVHDVGSRNGTFVNRERAEQTELKPGDVVTVGHAHFVVVINGEPEDVKPTPSSLKEGIEAVEYLPVGGHLPVAGDPQQQADYTARLAELDAEERELQSIREEIDRDRERLNADRRAFDEEHQASPPAQPSADASASAADPEAASKLADAESRIATLTGELDALRREFSAKGEAATDAVADAAKITAETAALAAAREAFDTDRASVETAQKEVDDARRSLDADRASLDTERKSIAELRERLDADRAELDRQREAFLATRESADAATSDLDAQRAALEQTSKQLEADHAAVREQRESLDTDRQQVDASRAEVESATGELDAARARIASQRKQLDERSDDLNKQAEALTQTRAELEQQLASLEGDRESIAADRAAIETVRATLDESRAAIDKDRSAIEEAEAVLEKSAADLERRTADLDAREGAITARESTLAEGTESLEHREQQLAARESEIAAATEQAAHRTADLDRRAAEIEAAEQQIVEVRALESTLRDRAAELDTRESQVAESEATLAQQREQIDVASRKLADAERDAEQRIHDLERRAAQLVDHLQGLGRTGADTPAVAPPPPASTPPVVSEIASDIDDEDEIIPTDADIDAPAPIAPAAHTGPPRFHLEPADHHLPIDVRPNHLRSAAGYIDRKGHWHLFADFIDEKRGAANTWNAEVRYYHSDNGAGWQWAQTPMPRGEWTGDPATSALDCFSTASPAAVVAGDTLLVFYAGRGGVGPDDKPSILAKPGEPGYLRSTIMLATCKVDADGSPADPFVPRGPVVEPGDTWDAMRVDQPTAVVVGDTVHLFYTGYDDARDLARRKVGYATATLADLEFTQHAEPVLAVPGGGETPRVFAHESRVHLFYQHFDHLDAARWRHYVSDDLPNFRLENADLFAGHDGKPCELMVWLDATGRLHTPHHALVTATDRGGISRLVPYTLALTGALAHWAD